MRTDNAFRNGFMASAGLPFAVSLQEPIASILFMLIQALKEPSR